MSTSAINTYQNLGLATISPDKTSEAKKQSLGQEQFLKLLTTQLTHQDPMKPMENGEFLGQMAQFSTVSGIQDLQASFKDFATSISSDQALQAAGLVGRYVSAPGSEGLLSAPVGRISGDFELPASSPDVKLHVIDPQTGETIRDIDLGILSAGKQSFEWNGLDSEGQMVSPGVYKIQVDASVDGVSTTMPTNIRSQVESVTMANGSGGLQVNLLGLEPVKFNQIKQIL